MAKHKGNQGGRPKGSENKMYSSTRQRVFEQYSVLPIDHFMGILNTPKGGKDHNGHLVSKADRMEAARMAAPYLHQKLAAVEVTGKDGGPVSYSIDPRKLTDEELTFFERIMTRAAIAAPANDDADVKVPKTA